MNVMTHSPLWKTARPNLLSVNRLESRETPAGNVTAFLAGGLDLYVVGDQNAQGNQVQVSQDAAGNVFVTGMNGTTVNGQSSVFVGNGIPRRVSVQLNGAGADYAELITLTAGTIDVSTGHGNDGIALSSVFANSIFVDAGAGNDGVMTNNVSTQFGANVSGGSDYDSLLLGPVAGPTNYQQFDNVIPV